MGFSTIKKLFILLLLSYLPTLIIYANQNQSVDKHLYQLAETYTQALLNTSQPYAYYIDLAIERHDKFIDNSPDGLNRFNKVEDQLLSEMNLIDRSKLSNQKAQIFYSKFIETLEAGIDKRICNNELWNVSHMNSPHSILSALIYVQPLNSEQDKHDALSRWLHAAHYYSQEISNLKRGLKLGYSASRRVVERVIKQLEQILSIEIHSHPYMQLARRADDEKFEKLFLTLLQEQLLPSMRVYSKFLRNEYLHKARTELGIGVLPKGRECYMAQYRGHTTLKRTPEQVHELGLETVKQNKTMVAELGKIIYGTDNFVETVKRANEDASQKFANGKALDDYYRAVVARSKSISAEYFRTMPTIGLEVEAIPKYQQGTGQGAHYVVGNNKRTAKFAYDPTNYVNENYGTAEIVSVHEGYPGHHQQIALVQEQKNFHPIESALANDAYAEGWARYAEALAEEADVYKSKSAKILRRSWPARGMVADTALHILGWSNEKVAAYIKESGNPSVSNDTDAMLDRMAAWPAQLTAYDSGALEIFALREQFKAKRGDKYDIKEFHQPILINGNVPMAVLKQQVLE